MKLVVVGGQSRKVGKTSIVTSLIGELKTFGWTALKITHHGSESGSKGRQPAENFPAQLNFLCTEEDDPQALRDTSRYLAAGARRALWLRVREGSLAEALPGLFKALGGDAYVIIESNSVMAFLKPAVFLLVIGESRHTMKEPSRLFLPQVDAIVAVGPGYKASMGPEMNKLEDKPIFTVSIGEWSNAALYRFVRERLASVDEQENRLVTSSPSREQE